MRFAKLPFKMLALSAILALGVLGLIAKFATNISCYMFGPFMLFLGICCIYSIVMQRWSQLAILAVLLLGCVVMLFGASWVIVLLENTTDKLSDFVRG